MERYRNEKGYENMKKNKKQTKKRYNRRSQSMGSWKVTNNAKKTPCGATIAKKTKHFFFLLDSFVCSVYMDTQAHFPARNTIFV